jgi:type IV secretion system protein VirD4
MRAIAAIACCSCSTSFRCSALRSWRGINWRHTQSLNQIEKAYGANNSILDSCNVRVSFSINDERTAKHVSDTLGTATEIKAMKNYAGSRLSPWHGHLMVSRSETARPC